MTTVIEAYDLFEPGKDETMSREKRFENLVRALFESDDVTAEKNKNVFNGRIFYAVSLNLTIRHEGLMKPLTFKDVAYVLCCFCKTLRIIREDGEELAFYTDAN